MKNKKQFSNYIMMCFISLVMVPVLMIAIFPFSSTTKKMIIQTKNFYSDILMQITDNVDLYYNRYDTLFKDIGDSKLFQDIINRSKQTAIEQVTYFHDGVEETGIKGLNTLASSKTRGSFCVIELDRPDALRKTSFSLIKASDDNASFEIEGIQNEPFFLKMKENKRDKSIMCYSYAVNFPVKERRVMFFRPYRNKDSEEIKAIMLIFEMQDFLSQLYEVQNSINFGTLYLMDQFGNVLDKNHPSINDYYDYDKKIGQYVLNEGENPNEKYEGMCFADYQMLNTDEKILNSKEVEMCIDQYEQRTILFPECKVVNYAGEKFLFIYMKAKDSQIQALYFHPLKQIFRSFYQLIFKIVLIILLVLIATIIVTNFFCSRFFNEILQLTEKQKKLLAGDCVVKKNDNFSLREFAGLDESFNAMANAISRTNTLFRDKIEKQAKEIEAQNDEIKLFNLAIEREKEKTNNVLRNIVPEKILQDMAKGSIAPEWFENVSIMICDISEINPDLSKDDSSLIMNELSEIFGVFDSIVEKNNCIRIKTAGNIYFAVSGIFAQDSHSALSLVKVAEKFRKYIMERNLKSNVKLQVKVGIHTGSVVGSMIGANRFSYDLFGENVNVAWYLKSYAPNGQIAISWSTYKLVAGVFKCNKQEPFVIEGYGSLESYLLESEIV